MRMDPRRKPRPDQLARARLLAVVGVCITGAVTFASVNKLGTLVTQQHLGLASAAAAAAGASGGNWKDTWRLASDLGAGPAFHSALSAAWDRNMLQSARQRIVSLLI